MKTKKMIPLAILAIFGGFIETALPAAAGEGGFYGWRVSGGGNFAFGLKTSLGVKPGNAMTRLPAVPTATFSSSETEVKEKYELKTGGERVTFADGGYVDPNSTWTAGADGTVNWLLPASALTGGKLVEVVDFETRTTGDGEIHSQTVFGGDDDAAYGASVQLDRTLWASEDNRWGVDAAIGLTWLKANDCFRASGVGATRNFTSETGRYVTEIDTSEILRNEAHNDYGNGTVDGSDATRYAPVIGWGELDTSLGTKVNQYVEYVSSSSAGTGTMMMDAHGDYEEWEISVLVRPWYNLTDWWRVNAALGLGITRSEFDFAMNAAFNGEQIYASRQTFDEWRCYGLAGLGTTFRLWRVDLSADVLARWCQEDMDIDGRDVSGTLEKPDLALRIALGFEF